VSDFAAFVALGFRHIVSIEAMDHLLFLLALAAVYSARDWRPVLWTASAFTVGHSLTLALAVTNVVRLPGAVIEFLIPVTIVLTALANLRAVRRGAGGGGGGGGGNVARPPVILMGAFGLVHGAGFANYLRSLFLDSIAVPLFGFNVGIELGQLSVLGVIFAAFALLDRAGDLMSLPRHWPLARLRTMALSGVIAVVAAAWAVERAPW